VTSEHAGDVNQREVGLVINSRDDHYCFGCGRLNPHGLRLRFTVTVDGEGVQAPFTPAREHEGFTELVHGGIISAALDEAMGWAVYVRNIWAVTGRLAVSFRRPVEVGVPTVVVGKVVSDRGRVVDTAAELRRADDGTVLASATATFVRVPEDQAEAWRQRYGVD
jgi:acyl-coenzyme A thioesterase PaaI-like protein